ncbi:MAG: hypothetical protein JRF63_08145 [Deltaproteobacteria bacterium]|nr:hypothetical protein [Deltaproteobacteria bacterium]
MSNAHSYPSLAQLEHGVIVDCREGDDPSLGELRASRLKLQASPGFPGRLSAADKLGDIEVLAQLPGREGWFRAGSLRGGFHTAWRSVDAVLIEDFVARLASALGLALVTGAPNRRRRSHEAGT